MTQVKVMFGSVISDDNMTNTATVTDFLETSAIQNT